MEIASTKNGVPQTRQLAAEHSEPWAELLDTSEDAMVFAQFAPLAGCQWVAEGRFLTTDAVEANRDAIFDVVAAASTNFSSQITAAPTPFTSPNRATGADKTPL